MKYYIFWIKSSRGTDAVTVRAFETPPTKEEIKAALEIWCSSFGAWHVSENAVTYGSSLLIRLPKNRKTCLAQHTKACKRAHKYNRERSIYASLLSLPPFNGQRVARLKGIKK
jgi:hypothetical protein